MADNEYDPDEQVPVPDLRPRLTALLPRATFQDIAPWEGAGFALAEEDDGDDTWVSVQMPAGWELREGSTGAQLLWDAGGRARFLVLTTGLTPVTEEDALRYA